MKLNKTRMGLLAGVIVGFLVIDYLTAMTYNFENLGSIIYLCVYIVIIAGIFFLDKENYKKFTGTFAVIVGAIAVALIIGMVSSARFLNAKRYAAVIGYVTQVSFVDMYGKDHAIEMSYVDKDSAIRAAEKRIGELSDVSSQFKIDEAEFSQINYQGNMVRVAPFQYADTFKEYTNYGQGVPYYVIVHTGDGNTNAAAEIVTLDTPMKYYPGAPLNYDLHRHVALNHKLSFLDDWYFEIDDEGNPYWLVQVIQHDVGLWGAKNMRALIVVDAVTGVTERYGLDAIPEWVDTVYPTDMLLTQARDHYTLSNGYFNSFFQQQNVMAIDLDEGSYNYVLIDDEIYVFTGIRPIKADASSTTGMLLISKRTGEAIQIDLPGVSLAAAESTATGSIQEKGYTPTTPVLQNIGGFPTYVMSLKDNSGVIRGFAYVNYQDYTKSAVGTTLSETEVQYMNVMGAQNGIVPEESERTSGTLEGIQQVIIDGNSYYILKLVGDDTLYQAPLSINYALAFMEAGQSVTLEYSGTRVLSIE